MKTSIPMRDRSEYRSDKFDWSLVLNSSTWMTVGAWRRCFFALDWMLFALDGMFFFLKSSFLGFIQSGWWWWTTVTLHYIASSCHFEWMMSIIIVNRGLQDLNLIIMTMDWNRDWFLSKSFRGLNLVQIFLFFFQIILLIFNLKNKKIKYWIIIMF